MSNFIVNVFATLLAVAGAAIMVLIEPVGYFNLDASRWFIGFFIVVIGVSMIVFQEDDTLRGFING